MRNPIILIFLLWFGINNALSQSYVSLNQYHGADISDYLLTQNEIADSIIQLFPARYHDSIVIVSCSNYLHSSKFAPDEQISIQLTIDSISTFTKYFIAIIGFSNEFTMHSNLFVKFNLPPKDSLTPCFNLKILASIETSKANRLNGTIYFSLEKYYSQEYAALKSIHEKFSHLINCCDLQRSSIEQCGECSIMIDDAISMLENDSFCNINNAIESILEMNLKVRIETKDYSGINSDYNIIFFNEIDSVEYSLTDGLEYYRLNYTDTNEFNVNIYIFDYDIGTNVAFPINRTV